MSARLPSVGELCDRVQFMRREDAPEPEGGHAAVYVPVATIWSRVRALPARSAFAADGQASAISHAVVTRYRTDVRPGDRFVYRGRKLDVLGTADLDGRRAFLSCQCTERTASP